MEVNAVFLSAGQVTDFVEVEVVFLPAMQVEVEVAFFPASQTTTLAGMDMAFSVVHAQNNWVAFQLTSPAGAGNLCGVLVLRPPRVGISSD